MLHQILMLNTMQIITKKNPNLKLMLMLEFQVSRCSCYKNIFAKGYNQNWSEEVFIGTEINS